MNDTQTNNMRDFMHSNYGTDKLDKSVELNQNMSIDNGRSSDDLTNTLRAGF